MERKFAILASRSKYMVKQITKVIQATSTSRRIDKTGWFNLSFP